MSTEEQIAIVNGVFQLLTVGAVGFVLWLFPIYPDKNKQRKPAAHNERFNAMVRGDTDPRWVKRNGEWRIEEEWEKPR